MNRQVFRFDLNRLWRNCLGLVPLAAFPLFLHLNNEVDPGLYLLFGLIAVAFAGWVIFTAVRFKMVLTDTGIECQGRIRNRKIDFHDVQSAYVRFGRDKAGRFLGPPPFRELVLVTADKNLVISSLPLGSDAFDTLLDRLAEALPGDVLVNEVNTQSS